MTHVKNAEAFARLVDFCTGYGGTYNPGRPTLQINSLVDQKTKTADSLEKVIAAKTLYDNSVNNRKQLFDQLPRLAARVMRILEASGASREKLDDARAYVQHINGSAPRANSLEPAVASTPSADSAGPSTARPHSQKQMSFAAKADAFAKLISAVAAEPLFIPNESALNVDGLTVVLEDLKTASAQVSAAQVAWSNARIDRNNVLYRQDQSMYRTGLAVKKYVRALFGPGSGQYQQLRSLSFTKPIK